MIKPRRENAFRAHLKKWNNGVLFGAKSKFAKKIDVSRTLVSAWDKGRMAPGEETLQRVANEFGLSVSEAEGIFVKQPRFVDMENGPLDYASVMREAAESGRTQAELLQRILVRLEALEKWRTEIEVTRRALPWTKGPKA